MSIFQKLADAINKISAPRWLKIIIQEVNDILVSILMQVGKIYLAQIRNKIIEVSTLDMPNKDKFNLVFDFTKSLTLTLSDSAINLLIETLVNQLKATKRIP